MSSCDLIADEVGINAAERKEIQRQLNEAVKEDVSMQRSVELQKESAERIEQMRLDKNEKVALLRGNKTAIDNAVRSINKQLKEVLDKEKDKLARLKLREGAGEAKEKLREEKRKINDRIDELRKEHNATVSQLREDAATQRNYRKNLRQFIRKTRAKNVQKLIDGDMEGARRNTFIDGLEKGTRSLEDAYSQTKNSANGLDAANRSYERSIHDAIQNKVPELMALDRKELLKIANDINHPMIKKYMQAVREVTNDLCEGLGVVEKYGFKEDPLYLPFAMNTQRFHRLLFSRLGTRVKEGARSDLKKLVLDTFDRESLDEHVNLAYADKDVPTLDGWINDLVNDHLVGNIPRINFNNVKFKSFTAYEKWIDKAGQGTVLDAHTAYLQGLSRDLAQSKVTGGVLPDKYFSRKFNPNLTDRQLDQFKLRKQLWNGRKMLMSSKWHAINNILNTTKNMLALHRFISLAMSPIADPAIHKASLASRYGPQINNINSVQNMVRGIWESVDDIVKFPQNLVGRGDADTALRNVGDMFAELTTHQNYRYDDQIIPMGPFKKPLQVLGQLFENVDNGLKVASNRNYFLLLEQNADKSLDDIGGFLGRDLRENFNIGDNEWKKLTDYIKTDKAQQNKFLDPSDFEGDLRYSIAAMENMQNMAAVANKAVILSPGLHAFASDHPILSSALSMFWSFPVKLLTYNLGAASHYAGKTGMATYLLQLGVRGFIPTLFSDYLFNTVSSGDPEKSWDKTISPGNMIDAFTAPYQKVTGFAMSALSDPSSLGYKSANPMMSEVWNVGKMIHGAYDAVSNPQKETHVFEQFLKTMASLIPFDANTPIDGIIKQAISPHSKPTEDLEYAPWVKRTARHLDQAV